MCKKLYDEYQKKQKAKSQKALSDVALSSKGHPMALRQRIVEEWVNGGTVAELAGRYDISRKTVYVWINGTRYIDPQIKVNGIFEKEK